MPTLLRSIAVLVAAGLAAATTAAAPPGPTAGTRISVFPATQTFPADQPFFVRHGWGITPQKKYGDAPGDAQADAVGQFAFTLTVDGLEVDPTFVDRSTDVNDPLYPDNPLLLWRLFVVDFPAGMTGMHTFTGTWIAPCAQAPLQDPALVCEDSPTAPVVVLTRTTVVTFVP